jgi:hypothetical protein
MGQSLVRAGQTITPAILNRIYGSGDLTQHTVNQASLTALSTTFTIPAGDAVSGTAYRLTSFGNGTWGSTQQVLTWSSLLQGSSVGTEPGIASTALSASANFDWTAEVMLICATSGASGTWLLRLHGHLNEIANNILPGTAADNTVPFTGVTHTSVSQDTTVAVTLGIGALWASTTGSPTLTCLGTLFEKVN